MNISIYIYIWIYIYICIYRSGRDSVNTVSSEVSQSSEVLLHPACDNRMAMTMLLLLEQENISRQDSSRMSSALRLVVCNIPLPVNLSGEILCPNIMQVQQQQRRSSYLGLGGFGSAYGRGTFDSLHEGDSFAYEEQGTIVLRGLPIGNYMSGVSSLRLTCCINALNCCVHYLCLRGWVYGWVYVFYVGHIDKIMEPISVL
jgi:hypothetical protein